MKTMKYPNLSGSNMAVSGSSSVDEVDSIFTSPCWQTSNSNDFIDTHKLIDSAIGNLGSDKLLLDPSIQDDGEIEPETTMEALGNLILSPTGSMSLAELKPLPPFTNTFTNGIQGHLYHTIPQSPQEENNNYRPYNEHIVSSSTCNVGSDSGDDKPLYTLDEVKSGYPNGVSVSICHPLVNPAMQIKTEIPGYTMSSIEDDIAVLIGSAIADTTVPNNNSESDDPNASRSSWVDIDAWIHKECMNQKNVIIDQDDIPEFLDPITNNEYQKSQNTFDHSNKVQCQQSGSTLANLLSPGILQQRLENGPPIKQEGSTYTTYDLITSSPPANVGSTTDNLIIGGRFINHYSMHSIHDDHRIRSPELMGQNYPHTTTTTPNTTKKSRSRAQKKQQTASSTVFSTDQTLGLLGKEKPVHRCSICNRGFLNKSNIKVHLRTHTGEKPFRCETCAKAFRQKAHLLKHQQIHKRIGRD